MMRIGICDDEAKAVQVSKDFIEKFLKKNKCEYEIHEFLNPEELYHYVREVFMIWIYCFWILK